MGHHLHTMIMWALSIMKKKVKQKSSREGCVIAAVVVVVAASWKKKIAIFDLWVCMKMSFVLRILIAYYSSMFSLKVLSTKNPCCCWKKFLVSKNVPCSFYNLSLLSFWIKRYKFLYSSKTIIEFRLHLIHIK